MCHMERSKDLNTHFGEETVCNHDDVAEKNLTRVSREMTEMSLARSVC